MKANTQVLFDKGPLKIYDNADEVIKDYLESEVSEGCRVLSGYLKQNIQNQMIPF